MSLVFDKSRAVADQIIMRFTATGQLDEINQDPVRGVHDLVFISEQYRRAHISVVDAREIKKLWLLHVTVFPHTNDPSPIYGFDIVAGPTKVSGAFHDYSNGGNPEHELMHWFKNRTKNIDWNKKRELPSWAKNIFSDSMVAIGAVGPEELDDFIRLGLETLDYYLKNVGTHPHSYTNYAMAQNFYCHNQRQNPHTPRVLVNLGFTEEQAKNFVEQQLFPEIS